MNRDDELVFLLSKGSDVAFTKIYDKYWGKLLAIAYNKSRDRGLSEEIVQEVFVSLWQRRTSLEIKNLSSYLATAVKFSIFKVVARNRRHSELEQSVFGNDLQLDEEAIDAKFLKDYLDGIVEELPERCRMVFRLSRESYLTNKEISQELEISEKAVESQITKALKKLKLSLQNVGLFQFFLLFFLVK